MTEFCDKIVVIPIEEYHKLTKRKPKNETKEDEIEPIRPSIEYILTFIPKNCKQKATSILNVFDHDKLSWNHQLELVVNGKAVKGSNLVDLIRSVTYKYKDFNPKGSDVFIQSLSKLNCPQSIITHSKRPPSAAAAAGSPPPPSSSSARPFNKNKNTTEWISF